MPTIQIDSEQLLNAALRLPPAELDQFVEKLLLLRRQSEAPRLSARESELLVKINQGLPPADAKRMKKLIAKRQSYTIAEDELQELIRLTDEAERLNVERVKHLIELAQLRNVTLDELMDKLGVRPAAL